MEDYLVFSAWLNPQTKRYDGKTLGNILVLGSTGSGKATLVQEICEDSTFGKHEEVYWISKVELSKQREAEIDSFEAVADFQNRQDEFDLKKTFDGPENLYQQEVQKQKIITGKKHEKQESSKK